ncbi:MAG: DEAD/DEAH box helicase family protein, partial [Chloroflexota bacterium]
DNPPYDQALGGTRVELTHLQADLELLLPNGLGIWIMPKPSLDFDACATLARHLTKITLRRFPEPEYERFKQVVVFGVKRHHPLDTVYTTASQLEDVIKLGIPPLEENELAYHFTDKRNQITAFNLSFPDISQTMDQVTDEGVHHGDAWHTLFGTHGRHINDFQPVLRLTSGHAAMVIAAGIVDGTEVDIEDQLHLIKGTTHKVVSISKEAESLEDVHKQTIREREQLVQTITALNMNNGQLLTFNSQDNRDGFADFLLQHQQTLVETIDYQYPPLFEPDRDMRRWTSTLNQIQAPGLLPGHTVATGLLPAQQIRAAALAAKLKTDKAVILVGEMGSGKTCVSQAIAALIGQENWKLVVVCPSQVTRKWRREAEKVLRQFRVQVHIIGEKRKQPDGQGKVRKVRKPVLDTIQAMAEPCPSILVMSYETAKNGARWEHSVVQIRKPIHHIVQVEETELVTEPPYRRVVIKEQRVTKIEQVLACPDCGAVLRGDYDEIISVHGLGSRKRRCDACNNPLWQQVPFKYGGRVAIADFLNRHYAGQFNLILDECHHIKGVDTDAGYAATDLISAASNVVAMTGTLYGGKASSAFYLLYRLFPHFRQLYHYNEVQRFIEHHGLQETIITTKSSREWSSAYGYKRENVRVRELPGVSPGMVTMLLNNTAFIKLADMGLHMPTYTEERFPVPLDERLQPGLRDIEAIYEIAAKLAQKNQPSLLSAWLYASLGWMDNPVDEVLTQTNDQREVVDTHPIQGVLPQNDTLLEQPLAKDQALLDIIEAELSQSRGVGVFFAQVNRRGWMGRIQLLLKQKGIYCEVLRQNTCKPEDRETWYRSFVERCRQRGQEPVLLGNGSLVKEGLEGVLKVM